MSCPPPIRKVFVPRGIVSCVSEVVQRERRVVGNLVNMSDHWKKIRKLRRGTNDLMIQHYRRHGEWKFSLKELWKERKFLSECKWAMWHWTRAPVFKSDIHQHCLGKVPWNHLIATSEWWCATGSRRSWAVHRGQKFTKLLVWCRRWRHDGCCRRSWLEDFHPQVQCNRGNVYGWQWIW